MAARASLLRYAVRGFHTGAKSTRRSAGRSIFAEKLTRLGNYTRYSLARTRAHTCTHTRMYTLIMYIQLNASRLVYKPLAKPLIINRKIVKTLRRAGSRSALQFMIHSSRSVPRKVRGGFSQRGEFITNLCIRVVRCSERLTKPCTRT